ncbi:probable cytochrome P450 6a13 isoform X3 [Diabrotica virgifera virgifera]|uniref:Probable cytochrome P450 6a13 n=1 Tax=Diabrotica virgifera virgifera TaxID=50390 RepID=A0A6P7H611_DIAVI|nr:probable cytochrome P450 6a13 isoform X3 [Diabrotica virgifera virgifera]XP_050505886.1 probable cytochrome P450 6a13 isoform X3 [Diabrotica virgifera virgifera]XP_050505887.1 probable cytochrome P450 6a13 isoform X3 [Diabrotica virgifera virgifera]KAI2473921.1 hypothetical protein C4B38_000019 [Diabrotica virgifera virgifera]
MSLFLTLLGYGMALLLVAAVSFYAYFLYSYTYWSKKGVPYLEPKFPYGNCTSLLAKVKGYSVGMVDSCYKKMREQGWKVGGFFTIARPTLLVLDPEYVRDILVKDFSNFVDRGFYYVKHDKISESLFVVDETNWKNIRTKLTPTFTTGKMKMMFPLITHACGQMTKFMEQLAEKKQDIDIRECLAMFTTDVIVSCALGLDSNCFTDKESKFRNIGKSYFSFKDVLLSAKVSVMNYAPELALKLGIQGVKKEQRQFFVNIIGSTVDYRRKNNVRREDFLQLMINLLDQPEDGPNHLTFDQVIAQVGIFFVAGFETSSSTMTFALYELAKHPELQDRLRDEINTALNDKKELTYESINEMKYLQQVIDETLRLYPVVSNLQRKCVKDYTFKNSNMVVERGVTCVIPIFSIQRDPEFFKDPLTFDPDRFSPENKNNIVPYSNLPFGEGPRNCIGLRFGYMQSKIGIIEIIRRFKLTISPSTKMPIQIDPDLFILQSRETLYLQAEPI